MKKKIKKPFYLNSDIAKDFDGMYLHLLGEKLKAIRESSVKTIYGIEEELKKPQGWVEELEAGKIDLGLDELIHLSFFLEFDLHEIISGVFEEAKKINAEMLKAEKN